ncbi:sigma-54 interaction domain-containing protein [Sorangium cellulosum]|uniref:sigma-54 interaction domain-containing protein n=1 Tax=Sorangium cellulosum TaxID=56 RepID=UPI003D9A9665
MKRLLLTWSDAGTLGPAPAHQGRRPEGDRGPVLRLLDQEESRYDAIVVLTIPAGEAPSRALVERARGRAPRVELRVVDVDDPSDYAKLFRALGPLSAKLKRAFPPAAWATDVLLSAGTPQAQTLWVILVQAGLLPARMLQVIPAAFVPRPHPRAVREVRLDIEGFPEIRALREEVVRLRAEARTRDAVLVGESEPMRFLRARIARVAATDVPVLILGETGTGKELAARAIHEQSPRGGGPFIAENCGVFAEGVLASELFGHEAGAFTGAAGRRRGVFEQAHGGTLFLDEIGELSPRVQASLLRVLQDGTLRRVGGEATIELDVRVLAATHRDLAAMVERGEFREDLYYRLRGAVIEVPPLRARGGDIEILLQAFLDEARARRKGRGLKVTREALRRLCGHPWPGNVRELRAEVLRWGVFCDQTVDVGDLAPEITAAGSAGSASAGAGGAVRPEEPGAGGDEVAPLADAVASAERAAIGRALRVHRGNISRAARALAIDRNTLKRKMAAYGLRGDEAA